mgnify:FL=1
MKGFEEILNSTIEHMRRISDSDAVVGKPVITEDGVVVLPVSKVSYGFVVGGGEYSESSPKTRHDDYPHAAASGGGITVTPMGFLVCGKEKKFISVDKTSCDDKWKDLARAAFRAIKRGDEDE